MKLLLSEQEIQLAIKDIVTSITILQPDVILCTLSGAVPFFSDLIKHLKFDFEVDYIKARSYSVNGVQDKTSIIGPFTDLEGKRVLVVEDIIDTGDTLKAILNHLLMCKCKRVDVASLLIRKSFVNSLRYANHPISLCYCFEIDDDHWLVGYGLDDNGFKRNLKDIYVNL